MLKLEPYINFTDPVKMRLIFINPYSEESLKISYDMKTFLTVISVPPFQRWRRLFISVYPLEKQSF